MHKAIPEIVRRLRELPYVQRIILFGSRAREEHLERSDIDLAVDASGAGAREWAAIEDVVEAAPTLLITDLVRLDRAAESLVNRITEEGVVLYDRRAG